MTWVSLGPNCVIIGLLIELNDCEDSTPAFLRLPSVSDTSNILGKSLWYIPITITSLSWLTKMLEVAGLHEVVHEYRKYHPSWEVAALYIIKFKIFGVEVSKLMAIPSVIELIVKYLNAFGSLCFKLTIKSMKWFYFLKANNLKFMEI